MDRSQLCGCKGVRTCFICEKEFNLTPSVDSTNLKKLSTASYCSYCNLLWSGWDANEYKNHPNHAGISYKLDGIQVENEFVTEEEETILMQNLDSMPWDISQSGRRKQNFGPKCNFKKRRISMGNFNGFPLSTKFVQDRFEKIPTLENYFTIEQCSLEYRPELGSSIDPHVDDCWIWGERIVTLSLQADTVLTLTPHHIKYSNQYNIDYIPNIDCLPIPVNNANYPVDVVRILMPRRSLLVLYGKPRYLWEHCILREDIQERRVCIAYREFTPPYLKEGKHFTEGCDILQKAKCFW